MDLSDYLRILRQKGWLIILLAGVLAAVGQLLMTYSYKHVTASTGSRLKP